MLHTVTEIIPQKRKAKRVNIHLDGEYAFSLSMYVARHLHVGTTLEDDQIKSIRTEEESEQCLLKALRFISYRPRTEKQVYQRLIKAGYTDDIIQPVLDRLKDAGYIQDDDYARLWLTSRVSSRPRSQRLMKFELLQKGVETSIIDQAMAGVEDDDDLAYRALQKQTNRWDSLDWPTYQSRASGYLLRRGFTYGITNQTVRRVWDELQNEKKTL